MNKVKNKRILFICPQFYNYQKYIKEELERQGANVTYIRDEATNIFFFLLRKLSPFLSRFLYSLYLYIKFKLDKKDYDYLFTIRGFETSKFLIQYLSKRIGNRIIYLWDSFQNQPNTKIIYKYFNKIYSFDYIDCKVYNLEYIPLFYLPFEVKPIDEKSIDILFIGKVHTDRYFLLKELEKYAIEKNLVFVKKLFLKKVVYWKRKLLLKEYRNIEPDDFIFKPLNKSEIYDLINHSKSVIDLSHSGQTGLSIRVFEILSQNTKLITNNPNILNEPFYNSNNIKVIDLDEKLNISNDFINSKFQKIDFSNYNLTNWIQKIFG